MTSFRLSLHGQRFMLDELQNARFRAAAREAVSTGGDLIEFGHEEGVTTALISASTPLVLTQVPEAAPVRAVSADDGIGEPRPLAPVVQMREGS